MRAKSTILIEPDGEYATATTQVNDVTGLDVSVSTPAGNQQLGAAFNKARDDLAALLINGLKARRIIVSLDATVDPS